MKVNVKDSSEKFVVLQGASCTLDDEGNVTERNPRGHIVINVREIIAFYDYTVIVAGHKIRVMETTEEIMNVLRRW